MNEENSTNEPVAPELAAANEKSSLSEPVEPQEETDAVNEEDLAEPVEPEQDVQHIDATPTEVDEPRAAAGGGAWSMPEPVFKKTSGYLPQGFEKQQFMPAAPQGNEDTTAEHPKPEINTPPAPEPAELAAVEPQPDVLEEGLLEPAEFSESPSPPQKKGVIGRILMILLALIIVGLMAAVLVAAIWFVLWPRPDATIN